MKRYPDTVAKCPIHGPGLFCLLASFVAITGYTQERPPTLTAADLSGASIRTETSYKGKSLYGYIDGGAEIFFEYGFRKAFVQDLVWQNLQVHLEVFEMASLESAAGIFSVSSQGCSQDHDPWQFSCANRFQAQAARGRYFVRASNISGTPEQEALTRTVITLVAAKVADSTYSAPALFRDTLFRTGHVTFLMAFGPLGIENGLDEWREFLEGMEKYRLQAIVQESGEFSGKIALLEIDPGKSDPEGPDRWEKAAPPGVRRFAVVDGPGRMLLCEATGDQKTMESYRSTLERYRINR